MQQGGINMGLDQVCLRGTWVDASGVLQPCTCRFPRDSQMCERISR